MLPFGFLLFLAVSVAGLAQDNKNSPEPGSSEAVPVAGPRAGPGNDTFYTNPEEDEKIFNGTQSRFRYPFFVAIMSHDGQGYWDLVCGGSLIDPSSVLTSGHCDAAFTENNGTYFEAWINPYYMSPSEKHGQVISIKKATTMDSYYPFSYYNDIGIYTLSRTATINKDVSTICIGSYKNYNNIKVELVGFGKTGCEDSSGSSVLFYAKGITISPDKCITTRRDINYKNNQLCAKLVNANSNYAEQGIGDAGSPLFRQANGKFTQVGVMSYCLRMYKGDVYLFNNYDGISGCPIPEYPGVYAIPALHIDFIRQHAPKATLCYRTENDKS